MTGEWRWKPTADSPPSAVAGFVAGVRLGRARSGVMGTIDLGELTSPCGDTTWWAYQPPGPGGVAPSWAGLWMSGGRGHDAEGGAAGHAALWDGCLHLLREHPGSYWLARQPMLIVSPEGPVLVMILDGLPFQPHPGAA